MLTHGHFCNGKRSPTYRSWQAMLSRCETPTDPAFDQYGGRGINVCSAWHRFENFLADMGERPVGKTLDRKDNNVGYSPLNCRWATRQEQQRNRRNTARVTLCGFPVAIYDACDKFGLKGANVLWNSRHSGISPTEAFFNALERVV